MKKQIKSFDTTVNSSISKWPRSIRPIMLLFTLFGQPPFTIGILVLIYIFGANLNNGVYMSYSIFGIATIGLVGILKLALHRARPINEYVKKMLIQSYSFPSGHAAGAISCYFTASIVISEVYPVAGTASWVIAILLGIFIGLSRLYLGAHYASDVVGGWLIGFIGILCAYVFAQNL